MRTLTFILLTAGIAAAQTRTDWTTTNQVTPYSGTVNVPQVNVPGVVIPQANTVDIRSATNAPPAPLPPKRRNMVPQINAPSAGDLARRNMVVIPPVLQPPLPATSQTNAAAPTVPTEIVPAIVAGHTWFVDRFGNDVNAGTSQQPIRTLQRAAALAQPGDSVLVAPGSYQPFRTVRGGEKTRPITFRAQAAGVLVVADPAHAEDNIVVSDTGYVVIEGFTVRGAPRAGISVTNSPGVVLRGNECSGSAGPGILLTGNCAAGNLTGALVEDNTLHDNAGAGLVLAGVTESIVQNNIIYGNARRTAEASLHITNDPDCPHPSAGNVIVNNTIVELRQPGIRFSNGAKDNFVFNNIIVSSDPTTDESGKNQVDAHSNVTRDSAVGIFQSAATGNYRLQMASPARNAGQAFYQGKSAPSRDREGQRRPGPTVAAGAFE